MQVIDQYEQTQGINVLHPEEHEGAKEVTGTTRSGRPTRANTRYAGDDDEGVGGGRG
jgi:hypothetical protein